jgi:hypothetical protein
LANTFGGWDLQADDIILQAISSYSANNNDVWKTSGATLEELMSWLVAVMIDDKKILLHNHWCLDRTMSWCLMDRRLQNKQLLEFLLSPPGDCMSLSI